MQYLPAYSCNDKEPRNCGWCAVYLKRPGRLNRYRHALALVPELQAPYLFGVGYPVIEAKLPAIGPGA